MTIEQTIKQVQRLQLEINYLKLDINYREQVYDCSNGFNRALLYVPFVISDFYDRTRIEDLEQIIDVVTDKAIRKMYEGMRR